MQISQKPVAELIHYSSNPRTHSEAQVKQLAASIQEFGWTNPIERGPNERNVLLYGSEER